jgi:cytochrome c
MTKRMMGLAATLAIFAAGGAWADGDAEAGKTVFHRCRPCHLPDAGVNSVGPSLHGIIGRHSASVDGYNYSDAMRQFNKTWDAALLDTYLADPRGTVPYIKICSPGVWDAKDRQDLIAYLATLK